MRLSRLPVICSLALPGMALILSAQSTQSAQSAHRSSSVSEPVYVYEAAGVRLEGTLIERREFGPPGFGETPKRDSRGTIFVLRLPSAITVKATPESDAKEGLLPYAPHSVKHVREVQIFPDFDDGYHNAKKLVGHPVSAVGSLSDPLAPGEYLKVSFNLTSLSPKP